MPATEVVTRRRLPHWYVPHAAVFVTYRLDGTIPAHVLIELDREREAMLAEKTPGCKDRAHKLHFAGFDACLDAGPRDSWLAIPAVAALIRRGLYFHDGGLYHLISYCVMPNHVHALFQPTGHEDQAGGLSPLARIMKSLKGFTSRQANAILKREGTLWQGESYDHWVRDEDELERVVAYIANNPVKAGLVGRPHEWYFSSAHDRFLADGSEEGWLPFPQSTE